MAWFRRHPMWTVLGVLVLAVVSIVGFAAITVWRAAHHDGAADIDRADAIVVLGAAQYNGVPSPVFQGRLDHAVLLWNQGRADLVITVGSKQVGDRHTEAEAGGADLEQQGARPGSNRAAPGKKSGRARRGIRRPRACKPRRTRWRVAVWTRRSSSRTHG